MSCCASPDAFRSGSLSETEEAMALSAELQGMIDTAQPKVARALQLLHEMAQIRISHTKWL